MFQDSPHSIHNQKSAYHTWFTVLTILSGLLHLIIVSLMHRENFIELWFFTFAGSIQLGFGLYAMIHSEKRIFTTKTLIIIHGALLTLWFFTRIMNAPFANYPESFGQFDGIIVLLELMAVIIGARILLKKNISKRMVFGVIALSIIIGGINYIMAKSSEKVFRSIPISNEKHGHDLRSMFCSSRAKIDTRQY